MQNIPWKFAMIGPAVLEKACTQCDKIVKYLEKIKIIQQYSLFTREPDPWRMCAENVIQIGLPDLEKSRTAECTLGLRCGRWKMQFSRKSIISKIASVSARFLENGSSNNHEIFNTHSRHVQFSCELRKCNWLMSFRTKCSPEARETEFTLYFLS